MSCEHDCDKPAVFPKTIFNRAALDKVAYRIGGYAEMREYMLDLLNKTPELAAWTHRESDDPGIALVEASAIVADILTFYQELYGNEAFLRTADWQESVTDLIQLLGYRPAPGIGGEATFAVKVKDGQSVTIPQGFGFKIKLEGDDKQSEFESTQDVTAYSHLSEFHLYRPRLEEQAITAATAGNQLELKAVDGAATLEAITAIEINAGDRIMLVPNADVFDIEGTSYTAQSKPEILIVSEVRTVLDRVVITFEGSIVETRDTSVDAYVIDRSFRHFGHDAPPLTTMLMGDPPAASFKETEFDRTISAADEPADDETSYYSKLLKKEMPLDQEVDDLAAGGSFICQGTVLTSEETVRFTVVRKINEIRSDSLVFGNKIGATTVVTLDKELIPNSALAPETADIRRMRFHEIVSPKLTLRAPARWSSGSFTDGRLNFFGTVDEAKTLAGRSLMLSGSDGSVESVTVSSELSFEDADSDQQRMWEIELQTTPEFQMEDFDEESPAVTVYGNLVDTTQGKTQDELVLGSGDNREEFQTLKISKAPLTYLLDGSATPPETPELLVYVGGVLWERVDTLFGYGSDDQVYVVRQDEDGASWVQFGNGEIGSRLPTGLKNVVAVYRTGTGAAGAAESGATPQAASRLTGLEKVFMPAPATGGEEAESEDVSREAAPGRMQSLGRLVSLADYEAEALAVPGVVKARADWAAPEGLPLIRLTVLTESGASADLEAVAETMATYNRYRGASRYPIDVVQGLLQYVYISLTVGYDPARRSADVELAVEEALVNGLFGESSRKFGTNVHVSQVLGYAQQADGVRWVEATAVQRIPLGTPPSTDPAELAIPGTKKVARLLDCEPTRILALYAGHLELTLVADENEEAS